MKLEFYDNYDTCKFLISLEKKIVNGKRLGRMGLAKKVAKELSITLKNARAITKGIRDKLGLK